MSAYEIFYIYEGKKYSVVERSTKGWESQFQQNVINRIESLVSSGAVITDLRKLY